MPAAVRSLVQMLDELGRVSDEPGCLTRTFLSAAMRRANRLVGGWMKSAGLSVREDTVGNLIGRLEGPSPKSRTLVLGSHLDTVRNAGRFDGPLGVLLPIAVLADLRRRGVRLPFAVEVIGFSEEEGVRFSSAYLGSAGFAGKLGRDLLRRCDERGVSVAEALRRFNGGEFVAPRPVRRGSLLGYVEVHIEQGPVLESRGLAVGVVSAIAGQSRFKLTWTGRAGHAGTTPMALRQDALAGAAQFITGVEALARRRGGLVATVGTLSVPQGAANVIPAKVVHSLDVRHADDRVRRAALMELGRLATRIATRRKLTRTWERTQENPAVNCAPALTKQLTKSVQAIQGRSLTLVSGAGHDGVVMSAVAPVAMLFVRCRDGLSHHPAEFAAPRDLAVAQRVMAEFLTRLAASS